MFVKSDISDGLFEKLSKNPYETMEGIHDGTRFEIRVAIPAYDNIVKNHYSAFIPQTLSQINSRLVLPASFKHFGVIIKFEQQREVAFYDADMRLDDGLREAIKRFGPVIIKNAFMNDKRRSDGHRNRFPQLKFHVDRGVNQAERHSYYHRDPFDPEQIEPRTSSTLFISNVVGYLQAMKEKKCSVNDNEVHITTMDLFHEEDVQSLLNKIILEHAWNELKGTGEISIIDNTTVLHSSYYLNPTLKGYRIGVRYLI